MDNSTPFWTVFSDTVKVEAGTTEYLKFRNYTSGAENWNNFVVILQNIADAHAADETNGYKEYGVVRADNWGWGAGYDGIAVAESNWNWDTFKSDMAGALVELAVTNNETTADIVATVTTMNGTVYTQKYTGIAIDGDLYYCLTVDGSWVSIFE